MLNGVKITYCEAVFRQLTVFVLTNKTRWWCMFYTRYLDHDSTSRVSKTCEVY